jgi:EAL domain-containing protein (putative c-di-GMP-specific phosphodiesterase class I)
VPADGDPRFAPFSESVINRAIDDWHHFFAQRGPIETAINLPMAFLQEPGSINRLCRQLPDSAAFEGLIVEINGAELVRDLNIAKEVASELRMHNSPYRSTILASEWLSLTGLCNFPFVELKVDRKFVTGCAEDRLNQSICRRILDLAAGYGARTVAEGVETWADFIAAREMGFDLVQGFLFAKPMSAEIRADLLGRHADLPSFAALAVQWGIGLRDPCRSTELSAPSVGQISHSRNRGMTIGGAPRLSGHNALEGLVQRDERVLK